MTLNMFYLCVWSFNLPLKRSVTQQIPCKSVSLTNGLWPWKTSDEWALCRAVLTIDDRLQVHPDGSIAAVFDLQACVAEHRPNSNAVLVTK